MGRIIIGIQSPTAGKVNNQALYPNVLVGENPSGLCCGTYARERASRPSLVPRNAAEDVEA
jgi:hypothetical protein